MFVTPVQHNRCSPMPFHVRRFVISSRRSITTNRCRWLGVANNGSLIARISNHDWVFLVVIFLPGYRGLSLNMLGRMTWPKDAYDRHIHTCICPCDCGFPAVDNHICFSILCVSKVLRLQMYTDTFSLRFISQYHLNKDFSNLSTNKYYLLNLCL